MKLVLETADSGLESADSSNDSSNNQANIGVWARALQELHMYSIRTK